MVIQARHWVWQLPVRKQHRRRVENLVEKFNLMKNDRKISVHTTGHPRAVLIIPKRFYSKIFALAYYWRQLGVIFVSLQVPMRSVLCVHSAILPHPPGRRLAAGRGS